MTTKLSAPVVVVLLALVALPARAGAQALNGLWDATVVVNNGASRFRSGSSCPARART